MFAKAPLPEDIFSKNGLRCFYYKYSNRKNSRIEYDKYRIKFAFWKPIFRNDVMPCDMVKKHGVFVNQAEDGC